MGPAPGEVMTPGVRFETWQCVAPTLVYLGALPLVMQPQPLGDATPAASHARGICTAPAGLSRLSTPPID
jgi:hypothetical protein